MATLGTYKRGCYIVRFLLNGNTFGTLTSGCYRAADYLTQVSQVTINSSSTAASLVNVISILSHTRPIFDRLLQIALIAFIAVSSNIGSPITRTYTSLSSTQYTITTTHTC